MRDAVILSHQVKGETLFRVSDMQSWVLGYTRGRLTAPQKLTGCNLYAYWDYPNETATQMIEKPSEFKRWAQKIFRWVRKATPEWHKYQNYRVTPKVARAIRAELELVQ